MKKKNASYFSNIYVHLTHALYKLYQQKFTASPCCFMQWQAGSENLIIFRRMLKTTMQKHLAIFSPSKRSSTWGCMLSTPLSFWILV